MTQHLKTTSLLALVFSAALMSSTCLKAQDANEILAELVTRVGEVEAENRELRGLLDENKHEVAELKKRMETLSADVDYRLTNPDSGAPAPLPTAQHQEPKQSSVQNEESAPIPLGKTSHVETTQPISKGTNSLNDYETARAFLEQGDYEAAEKAFAGFVTAHPKDEHAGAAQYWLGVTFFVRGQHEKAAKAFAKGYKSYPKSPKAPDNLFKLAMSLAALDRTADACATLEQISNEYPKSHTQDVASERKKLKCK